jgi:hypothetical protein
VAMRRGRDGGRYVVLSLVVGGAWACANNPRVHPEPIVPATACTLSEAPSISGNTATITFDAVGATPEWCALVLVAETLRPWPTPSTAPWSVHISLGSTMTTIRRLASDAARNVVDAGSALLATDDLDLIAYAATRPDLQVDPLPWDRTYLRLSHASQPLGPTAGPDAVRADARKAEPRACEFNLPDEAPRSGGAASRRVVFDVADRTARELAERTVALLEISDATAAGVSAPELAAALGDGNDLAYIISVPRASYCESLATLMRSASWSISHSALPLIDTRAHGIAPRTIRP